MWAHLWSGLPIRTRRRLTAGLRAAHEEKENERLVTGGTPEERVKAIVDGIQPLDTVQQRLDALLKHLAEKSPALGAAFMVDDAKASSARRQCLDSESDFTLAEGLVSLQLCQGEALLQMGGGGQFVELALTPAGWARYEQLRSTSTDSKVVFLALSNHYGKVDNDGKPDKVANLAEAERLRAAMKATLPDGYSDYRVEDDLSADHITDAIVAGIRRAPFVIADLTNARPNVYFEAGLAMGYGKPVVFCVRKNEQAHFDVHAYRHIEWDPEDLEPFTKQLKLHLIARGLI